LFTDADKEALEEFNSGIPPNVILLKARLLTDGAYFDRAIQLLQGKTVNDFSSEKDKLEFTYRLGRIYEETGDQDKAIPNYIATIDQGSNSGYYFADNASLHLAGIYEKQKDFDHARAYYTKCLQMKDNVFKTSIDQKAKAGLSRLNNQNTR
jgi:tetratricopeptide (TPR) repeat protein